MRSSPTKTRNSLICRSGGQRRGQTRVASIDEKEGRVAGRRMNRIVHGELGRWKEGAPAGGNLSGDRAKHVFENAVDSFRLAIRLGMVGRGHGETAAHQSH